MKCPHCSSEISSSAKFCPECGTPLGEADAKPSPEADRANLLQKYIPPELAKRILSAGKQVESERRLVTVLFADVSGFTAMSEKLDAEEVSSVLNDCFKGLISIVYKYEGVIDKFIGDEIMAIFGAPLTHENDPERALRCSMEMMEYMERFNQLSPVALPEPLGLHISMNTGMVVAGNVGSDLRMNYSVIGDTVNLASRLKHIAERGEIVVSEDTYRIVSSLVNAEEPRTVEVKGKSEPVKVYKVLSIKGEIEPGTRVTQKSPIIGRDQEIGQLKTAVQQVLQKKEQRLFIRGEAGVGKTRLKLELIQLAKASGITAYEGKCSSFEINTPYYLWTTLLKDILQVKPDSAESETRKRLRDMLQILSMEKHEPYLATLLSLRYEEILLEEDAERKKRIFESLKEFIRALAKRKSSLFLLEDIHWIDRFSQDMLMYLFAEKDLAPAIFVTLFRDEYVHSKELIEKGGTLIDLNRLEESDAKKLMCTRLQVEEVPSSISDLVYKRSEGNPFFIEELIKTLLDKKVVAAKNRKLEILKSDVEDILPETVQGVIMARIDRLEEKLKEVLYGASVIGREFDTTLLTEILKKKEAVAPSLQELLSLELILEREEAKELAYFFKHYLIQEVAYNTILQKKRKELHGLIARTIEHLYADRLKEFYELLAFHYEKAEEWEKAAEYLGRAGRKVGEMFSREETNNFSQRRDTALEKVYQSKSATRIGLRILAGIVALVASIQILGLAVEIFLLLSLLSNVVFYSMRYLDFELFIGIVRTSATLAPNIVRTAGLIALAMLGGTYISLFFVFYGVLPLLRRAPRVYDVTPESVEIVFRKRKFVIPFTQITEIIPGDPEQTRKRQWRYRILDPFHRMQENTRIPFFALLRKMSLRVPAFSFGFSSRRGDVQIVRKHGLSLLQLVFPFLFTSRFSKVIVLCPADPKEFSEELRTAFAKWQMRQAGKETSGEKKSSRAQAIAYLQKHRTTISLAGALAILVVVGYALFSSHHFKEESLQTPHFVFRNADSLEHIVNVHPLDHQAWQELGEALLQKLSSSVEVATGVYWGYSSYAWSSRQQTLDKAATAFSKASALDASDARSMTLLGRTLFYKYAGNPFVDDTISYISSLQCLHRAVSIQPQNPDPYIDLVLELTYPRSYSGQLPTARKYMDTALVLAPRSGRAKYALATLLVAEERYSDALPVYEQALDLGLEDEMLYLELPDRWSGCVFAFQRDVEKGDQQIAGNIFKGAKAIAANIYRYTEVANSVYPMILGILRNFQNAVKLRMDNPAFYMTLSWIYLDFGQQQTAASWYVQGFVRDSVTFHSPFFATELSYSKEQVSATKEKGMKLASALVDSFPGNYWALLRLGDLQCTFADPFRIDSSGLKTGMQTYANAIKANSNNGDAYLRMSCASLKANDSLGALHYLDTALTKEIKDVNSLKYVDTYYQDPSHSNLNLKLNRYLLASGMVDPIIPLDNLAMLYAQRGDVKLASRLYQEILQKIRGPLWRFGGQKILEHVVSFLIERGRYDEAIETLTQSMPGPQWQQRKQFSGWWGWYGYSAGIEESLTLIGYCYAIKGDEQRARSYFHQAMNENPAELEVKEMYFYRSVWYSDYFKHEDQFERVFTIYKSVLKEEISKRDAAEKTANKNHV